MAEGGGGDSLELLELASRIESSGYGLVRRVIAIGSFARGTAGPTSDLDLVIVVEPLQAEEWSLGQLRAWRERIVSGMVADGRRIPKLDVWIRTTDQYEDGRSVVGGFEHLADSEGLVLLNRSYTRCTKSFRTPDQVRRANIRAWLVDAFRSLHNAAALSCPGSVAPDERTPGFHAARSVQRALTAVLVAFQVPSSKQDPLGSYLEKLSQCDPQLAGWIGRQLVGSSAIGAAYGLLIGVLGWTCQDEENWPYLRHLARRATRPLIYFDNAE